MELIKNKIIPNGDEIFVNSCGEYIITKVLHNQILPTEFKIFGNSIIHFTDLINQFYSISFNCVNQTGIEIKKGHFSKISNLFNLVDHKLYYFLNVISNKKTKDDKQIIKVFIFETELERLEMINLLLTMQKIVTLEE